MDGAVREGAAGATRVVDGGAGRSECDGAEVVEGARLDGSARVTFRAGAGAVRVTGSGRGDGAERTKGAGRVTGSERGDGAERMTGSGRGDGAERTTGTGRVTGSERGAGAERTTGAGRVTGSERGAGAERDI